MAAAIEITVTACERCGAGISHDILFSHRENSGEEYHSATYHRVVKCRGCQNVSFLYEYHDYEQGYHDREGEWEYDTTIENYPRFISDHHEIDGIWFLPPIVAEIYKQSLISIREKASILAGMGLRATIEAICNDRQIPGKNLELRISKLASTGLISKKDADRLHAIRFLGNDAAHDIKGAKTTQLSVALKIIEHLMQTIYVLEKEADGQLETTISNFSEFKKILDEHISEGELASDVTLISILGKDSRRIYASLPSLEAELIAKISSGDCRSLELGKTETVGTPPKPLQLYTITAEALEAAEEAANASGPKRPPPL